MAFADWTSFGDSGGVASLETSSPLVGTGSLKLDSGGGGRVMILPTAAGPLLHGFNKGRLQSLIRVVEHTGTSPNDKRVGFAFQVSNESLPLTNSAMYLVEFTASGGVTDLTTAQLVKRASSGLGTGSQVSVASAAVTVPFNTTFALEVDWVGDLGLVGGTLITARWKIGTDFTGLAELFSYTDTSSPLLVTDSEALFCAHDSGNDFAAIFDETSIFELV